MPSSHRGVLPAWGLAVGLATTAWGQGEFSLGPPKEKPSIPVKEPPEPPAPEKPSSPVKEDPKKASAPELPAAPAEEGSSEAAAVDRCQPLKHDRAGQLAIQGGDALANRRYLPAKKLISDALRAQPDVGALRLALAAAMARVGELEAASREYQEFLTACPKHTKVATVRKVLDEYHHTKGPQAFASPVVDELAKGVFDEDVGTEALCDESQIPEEARAAYGEGVRLLNSGKASRAAASFQHVLELEPRSVMARLMLGSAYSLTDRPDEAAQAYMTFLTLCPDHPRAEEVRQLVRASGLEPP